jgi:hypothetical protein
MCSNLELELNYKAVKKRNERLTHPETFVGTVN